jgi:hypothetical protein
VAWMGIDRVGLLLDVNGQCDINGRPSDVVGAGRRVTSTKSVDSMRSRESRL